MTAGDGVRRRSYAGAVAGFLIMVAMPTLASIYYYAAIAADRYVTEIRYAVRGGAAMARGGEEGLLGGGGALALAGDSFILEDYIASIQALEDIGRSLPIRRMLARDGGDPVRRFDPNAPLEDILPFWTAAVSPRFDALTGITTVEVALFRPEDAQRVGRALVDALRRIVDSLSAEARMEMLAYVDQEFARARRDLAEARQAIEAFRRDNRLITPEETVSIGSTIISELSRQITDQKVMLRALRDRAPNSPRIEVLEGEIRSLEAQLAEEIGDRAGRDSETTLPEQLTSFDELQNTYEIARENYISTQRLRQEAEAAAALGQVELVIFVSPRAPTLSTAPDRPIAVLKVFGVAFAVWLILRILLASLRAG